MGRKKLLIDNPIRRSLFLGRGVPHYVLFGGYPDYFQSAITRIEVQRDDGMKTIKPDTQKKILDATLSEPYASNYLYVLGSEGPDDLTSQIALRIMLQGFDEDPTGKNGRPYWHVINGSTRDNLRDSRDFREVQASNMSMLILSGVAANSTMMKIEKLRDLLTQYSNVPRVVILSGAEPMKFCLETLYMKPTRVMYFGRRRDG